MSAEQEILDCLQSFAAAEECRLNQAPPETREWLQHNAQLPTALVRILSDSWPSDDVWMGTYYLCSLDHLSDSEMSKITFAGGFFAIGAAGNGDLLVVRRRSDTIDDCEIGLISHEELWERRSELESIYEPVCRGFLNFLKKAARENELPLDFYDARAKRQQGSVQT